MSAEDDRRVTDRFVAGLSVDADELAEAIAARAIDRAVVVEVVLKGLEDDHPAIRRRTATRIARMPDLDPSVAARLTVLAGTDPDSDVREAGTAALRAHGLQVPGEAAPASAPAARSWLHRSFASALLLTASVARSGDVPIEVEARYDEDAPEIEVVHWSATAGELRLELVGLPANLVGTEPVLRGRVVPAPAPLTPLGEATAPVSKDGRVTIRVPLDVVSMAEVTIRLSRESDLALPDD
jgi:hypothetical protein